MKKLFAILLALAMMLSCCACGKTEAPETEAPTEPAVALENEDARIEGIYVDLSYDEGDGSPLKMVYVFLTLNPTGGDVVEIAYEFDGDLVLYCSEAFSIYE